MNLRTSLLLAALLSACAPTLSVNGAPCPCAQGWTCCPGAEVCAKEVSACPAAASTTSGGESGTGSTGGGTSGSSTGTTGAATTGSSTGGPTCTNACTPGDVQCLGTAVSTCDQQSGSCPAWSAPVACANDQFCSLGVCRCDDTTCTRIYSVSPNPATVGQTITITGRAFGYSIGATQVLFNQTEANSFRSGSSDTQLVVQVPDIPGLVGGSASVVLTVSNDTSTDQTLLTVDSDLQFGGDVDVIWQGVTPATVTSSQPATFQFLLNSRANLGATYTVAPAVYGSSPFPGPFTPWGDVLSVIDEADGGSQVTNEIFVPAGGQVPFAVQVSAVPSGNLGYDGGLNLVVNASSAQVFGSSELIPFQLGVPLTPPSSITLDLTPWIDTLASGSLFVPSPFIPTTDGPFELTWLCANLNAPDTYRITTSVLEPESGLTATLNQPGPQLGGTPTADIDVVVEQDGGTGYGTLQLCVTDEDGGATTCSYVGLLGGACTDACDPGAAQCQGNAVATCEQQASGCTAWSQPAACSATDFCTLGVCRCGAPGCVQIEEVSPAGPYFVGYELSVTAQGLDTSTQVYIDQTQVTQFVSTPWQNGGPLVFDIPTLPNLPATGKQCVLTVSNSTSSDQTLIDVLPEPVITGIPLISWVNVTPATLVADQPATFWFRLDAEVNQAGVYTLSPAVYAAQPQQGGGPLTDWSDMITIVLADGGTAPLNAISVPAQGSAEFGVQVAFVPGAEDGGLILTVQATGQGEGAGQLAASSGVVPFAVGARITEPSPGVALSQQELFELTSPSTTYPLPASPFVTVAGETVVFLAAQVDTTNGYACSATVLGANSGIQATIDPPQFNDGNVPGDGGLSSALNLRVVLTSDGGTGYGMLQTCVTELDGGESSCYDLDLYP